MPTYEYVCKACDLEFEREQRISDPPIKTCPRCKAKQVKKLISRTAFHLKGGGWYSDLYSKGPKKGDKGGAAKPAAESGGASDAGAKSSDAGSKSPDSGSKGPDSGSKAAA